MQNCFYTSSGAGLEPIPQDETKSDRLQCSNFYWPPLSTSNYNNYSYPSMQSQWGADEKSSIQHLRQWDQTQETISLHNSVSIPPMPLPQSSSSLPDSDLELFAEHFKQRRMKLGATQADVGKALGAMMIPGVESLSQSTICRFESLTLSRTNMIALRPLLQIWLDRAETLGVANGGSQGPEVSVFSAQNPAVLQQGRRKRTCITDSERRALEAYFAVQPQPSSERVAQIASLLGLPKSVVRVWFCNQRQKQKRLKCGFENARSRCVVDAKTDVDYFSR
ncbi:Inhibitory POU protein [Echinococcus granulosus]|uniref:POU domain protein n=1 Tax=Echinococcus granulosus TaxID=6210 RepID=A0A068WGC3_ECHGR|nr:Inhibitory POU protein [Echinococcus granulosus]CDS17506.1 POU homeobox domain class 4 transcription factor [Echinococcus granulosus]